MGRAFLREWRRMMLPMGRARLHHDRDSCYCKACSNCLEEDGILTESKPIWPWAVKSRIVILCKATVQPCEVCSLQRGCCRVSLMPQCLVVKPNTLTCHRSFSAATAEQSSVLRSSARSPAAATPASSQAFQALSQVGVAPLKLVGK